jgi:hypothetical protein
MSAMTTSFSGHATSLTDGEIVVDAHAMGER